MTTPTNKVVSGRELVTGVVALGSLITNLVQLANRSHLEKERDALRSKLHAASQSLDDLRAQLALRVRHVQTLLEAYEALKKETTELNRIIEMATAESAQLRKQLATATAKLEAIEAEKKRKAATQASRKQGDKR